MSRRVLVVDDDRPMVYTIRAILDRKGWESIPAYSGEEAIELAGRETRLRAVLMDIRMPGVNGVDACRTIRTSRPETPVILMTAYATPDRLADARQSGARTVLPKPLAWPTLPDELDRIQHDAR